MFNRACLTWCLSDVTQDVSPATLGECQRWADSAAGLTLSISLDLQAPPFYSELPNLPSGCGSLQRRVWQAVSRDSMSRHQQGPARTDTGLTPAYSVSPHGPFHLHEALWTTLAPS